MINDPRPRPPQAILTNFSGLLPSFLPWQKDGRADVDFLRQEFGDMEVPVSMPRGPVRPDGGRTICTYVSTCQFGNKYMKVSGHYVPRLVCNSHVRDCRSLTLVACVPGKAHAEP